VRRRQFPQNLTDQKSVKVPRSARRISTGSPISQAAERNNGPAAGFSTA